MFDLVHFLRGRCCAVRFLTALLLFLLVLSGATTLPAAGNAATVTMVSVPGIGARSGRVVTLHASVTANGAPVIIGDVTFLEGSVVLGSAPLQSDGTASLRLQFPPGKFQIVARFNGSSAGQPSTSQPGVLTQLGTARTVLSSARNPNNSYTFSATVTGNQPVIPTGAVTFFDVMTGRDLGTADLEPGTAQSGLQPGLLPSAVGSWTNLFYYPFVWNGDFNGDGLHDYAKAEALEGGTFQLQVYLGRTDGSFEALAPQPISETEITGAADFNRDGKTDLIEYGDDTGPFTTNVLRSNGDGTFTEENLVNGGANGFGDFNGDGNLDLLMNVGNFQPNPLIELGDGTGNFNSQLPFSAYTIGPTADYNHDGNLDLIAAYFDQESGLASYPSDYAGNGTGDFSSITVSSGTPIPSWPTHPQYTLLSSDVAADFNGDGNQDIAVYDGVSNIDIYLGDGKGGFGNAGAVPTGPLVGYSTMDVNGDGIVDMVAVLASSVSASGQPNATPDVAILLGKGDGTFTIFTGASSTPVVYPLLGAGTINDLAHAGPAGIASVPASGTATAAVTISNLGPGGHLVFAIYHGNGILPPSLSPPLMIPRSVPARRRHPTR